MSVTVNLDDRGIHTSIFHIGIARQKLENPCENIRFDQVSLFDTPKAGDLDLFLRYDFVSLGQDVITGRADQRAIRTGVNYNLPFTGKLASLHFEYAHNSLSGPAAIVTTPNPGDEFRIGIRISLQRYQQH